MYESVGCFLFQAEDGIRDLVRSRGLGDVYKRQQADDLRAEAKTVARARDVLAAAIAATDARLAVLTCLLYTSDAADERSSVDLGGRRIIKKTKHVNMCCTGYSTQRNADQQLSDD